MRSSTADSGLLPEPAGEDPVVTGDTEQAEPDDEQAGHRAGAEGDLERGADTLAGGLRGAHIRANGDVHADEPGGRREQRTNEEADRRAPAELVVEPDGEERHDRDRGNRRVLLLEVRRGALLHGPGDRLHPLVAGRLREQPPGQVQAERDRDACTDEREQHGVVNEEVHPSSGTEPSQRSAETVSARGIM